MKQEVLMKQDHYHHRSSNLRELGISLVENRRLLSRNCSWRRQSTRTSRRETWSDSTYCWKLDNERSYWWFDSDQLRLAHSRCSRWRDC